MNILINVMAIVSLVIAPLLSVDAKTGGLQFVRRFFYARNNLIVNGNHYLILMG